MLLEFFNLNLSMVAPNSQSPLLLLLLKIPLKQKPTKLFFNLFRKATMKKMQWKSRAYSGAHDLKFFFFIFYLVYKTLHTLFI